jgi:hypothetical protein
VVNDHRARNRANKPPSQQRLLDAAKKQLGVSNGEGIIGEHNEGDDEEDEDDDDDDEDTSRTRAVRHSKSDGTAKPTTARYYPGSWGMAINEAKTDFRRFTMLHNLFPLRDSHLADAAMILSKVITGMKSKDTMFDQSKFLYLLSVILTFSPLLYRLHPEP